MQLQEVDMSEAAGVQEQRVVVTFRFHVFSNQLEENWNGIQLQDKAFR